MNKYRIAVSLTSRTVREMWNDGVDAIRQGADFLETRLDLLDEGERTPEKLEFLMNRLFIPIIITNRHGCEASHEGQLYFQGSPEYENERIKVLQQAVNFREKTLSKFDFIDLEHRHYHDVKRNPDKIKLILSWHDFIMTPPYKELEKRYHYMVDANPNMVKIATMVNYESDKRAILNYVRNLKDSPIGLIAIGMGELGKTTRIEAPKLGSYLTFACLEGKPAAPGQLTISQLRKAWKNEEFF